MKTSKLDFIIHNVSLVSGEKPHYIRAVYQGKEEDPYIKGLIKREEGKWNRRRLRIKKLTTNAEESVAKHLHNATAYYSLLLAEGKAEPLYLEYHNGFLVILARANALKKSRTNRLLFLERILKELSKRLSEAPKLEEITMWSYLKKIIRKFKRL